MTCEVGAAGLSRCSYFVNKALREGGVVINNRDGRVHSVEVR